MVNTFKEGLLRSLLPRYRLVLTTLSIAILLFSFFSVYSCIVSQLRVPLLISAHRTKNADEYPAAPKNFWRNRLPLQKTSCNALSPSDKYSAIYNPAKINSEIAESPSPSRSPCIKRSSSLLIPVENN